MPKYLIIHHSAVSQKDQPIQLYAINRYHKEQFDMISSLGFYIGYHYVIDCDGTLTQTRKENEESAAVIGHNTDSVHICLAGNFDIEVPNLKQLNTLKTILDTHKELEVKFHREMQVNRTCPGKFLTHEWLVEAYKPGIAPKTVDEKKAEQIKAAGSIFDAIFALLSKLKILMLS
jgi:hypothetical protein